MSKSKIPPKVVLELWARAAGRCQKKGCNRTLFESMHAPESFNAAEMAHIIANLPNGPRGGEFESERLAKDANNLMLLCPSCHREIDKENNLDYYTVELLTNMKKEHESRIRLVTDITEDNLCHVITYYASIGDNETHFKDKRLKADLLPHYFTRSPHINLGMSGKYDRDNSPEYWKDEEYNLIKNFNKKVRPQIEDNKVYTFTVFALAPIPLLIKLGTLLDDKVKSVIYQKHRYPDTWKWMIENQDDFEYLVNYPKRNSDVIALNISLSGTITNDRIQTIFTDKNVDICTVTLNRPKLDFLSTQKQLDLFSSTFIEVLDKLKKTYGHKNELHIFPACPSSVAVEIGRRWLKKSDMKLIIYDENKSRGGFIKALEISSEYE